MCHFMDNDKKIIAFRRRENLIELLDLLADTDKQIDYAKLVGDETAIGEMICMWFDDQYNPDNTIYASVYTDKELAALKKFNDYYASIADIIPDDNISTLLMDIRWTELVGLAKQTKSTLTL